MISPSSDTFHHPSLREAVAPRVRYGRVSGGGTHIGSRDVLVGRRADIYASDRGVAHAERVDLIFCVELLLNGWRCNAIGVSLVHRLDVGRRVYGNIHGGRHVTVGV